MRPLVIVPTYNERANIRALLETLLRADGLRVMVVDDGSPDGTGALADACAAEFPGRVEVVHRQGARGLGRSYCEGFARAMAGDATHVIQMDADFSHDPADVTRLLSATARADLVVGSRYVSGGRLVNWPAHRRALSRFANFYVHVVTGIPVSDCTSGFRAWTSDLLRRMPLGDVRSDGYAFQVEMTWLAWRARARILEVPITFVERQEGTSKLSGGVIVESALMPWQLRRNGTARRPA